MVSSSQNAACFSCFSNRGEFILRVFSQGFVSGSFFLTLLNPAIFFFEFLCVRLPSLCFPCVSGLEFNFYRHHLELRKVPTFCTTLVWPVCRSRGEAWIPYFPSSCEGNRINWRWIHCSHGLGQMPGNGAQWRVWRSEEHSIPHLTPQEVKSVAARAG